MPSWAFLPGAVLVGASVVLTLAATGSAIVKRPTMMLTLAATRLRFLGMGLLLLIPGVTGMLSGLWRAFDVGLIALGAFMAVMGGVYFYAATDPIFKKGGKRFGWPRKSRKRPPPTR